MKFKLNKMILYIVIIASGIDFILPWPISNLNPKTNEKTLLPANKLEARFTRQVVQPTWLNFDREQFIDPVVHVNSQSLSEAEEIRKIIQKAVKEDTFVVTDKQRDTNDATVKFFFTPPPVKKNEPDVMHGLSNWFARLQNLWSNWTQNVSKGFHKNIKDTRKGLI